MFDPEVFVAECRAAAAELDAPTSVRDVVAAAIVDGPSIDAVLGTEYKGEPDTLFSSDGLTVQRIRWPSGSASSPHEHRMWAVVGVYAGEEKNRLFERSPDGLQESATRLVAQDEVLVLDEGAIHAVENPNLGWTSGLHVYGGDILNIERSAWGPDGRECPFDENAAERRAMFRVIYDVGAEHAIQVDNEARYRAITALQEACDNERRYVAGAEARRIVADAWDLETD